MPRQRSVLGIFLDGSPTFLFLRHSPSLRQSLRLASDLCCAVQNDLELLILLSPSPDTKMTGLCQHATWCMLSKYTTNCSISSAQSPPLLKTVLWLQYRCEDSPGLPVHPHSSLSCRHPMLAQLTLHNQGTKVPMSGLSFIQIPLVSLIFSLSQDLIPDTTIVPRLFCP